MTISERLEEAEAKLAAIVEAYETADSEPWVLHGAIIAARVTP